MIAKNLVVITLSITFLFFLSYEILAQSMMLLPDQDPRGKVYVDEWLEAPLAYDQWGHPTPEIRRLNIRVVGPETISLGTNGVFYLDITPEHAAIDLVDPRSERILDFYIELISTEDFIMFSPEPKYKVMLDNRSIIEPVIYSPDDEKFYAYLGKTGLVVFRAVVGVGQLLSVSEALGQLVNWRQTEEPDWLSIWDVTNRSDIFPVVKPVASSLSGHAIRRYEIELPFSAVGRNGRLMFHIAYINISHELLPPQPTQFKDQDINILNITPEPVRRDYVIRGPEQISKGNTLVSGTPISLDMKATLSEKKDQNTLSLSFQPDTAESLFAHLEDVNLILEFKKSVGKVSGFPEYHDWSGAIVPFKTMRQQLGEKAVESWAEFAVGLIRYIGQITTLASGIVDISEAAQQIQHFMSFSETIRQRWQSEAVFNLYQLPPLENKSVKLEGKNGCRIDIPVTFYSDDIQDVNVYFQSKLHWGYIQTSTGEIAVAPAVHQTRRIAYKILLNFEKPEQTTLGFILDSSGSMQENDPRDMRKEALKMIVNDRLSGQENVFLVEFDEESTWLNPSDWMNWSKKNLVDAIDKIDSEGNTSVQAGLTEMETALRDAHVSSQNAAVVLLSDGLDNCSYQDGTTWYVSKGIPVYTISFVGEVNEALMTEIAQFTGGDYMKVSSANEIVNVFNRFYNMLSGSSTFIAMEGFIQPGEVIHRTFYIDSEINNLYLAQTWGGSDLGLVLRSPSGMMYSKDSGLGEWNTGENFLTLSIPNPEIGQWSGDVIGVNIPPAGEPFMLEIHGKPDLIYNLNSIPGSNMQFQIVCSDPVEVQNTSTAIKVKTPQGKEIDISSNLVGDSFSYIPRSGEGSYKFTMNITGMRKNGQHFQRHLEKHVFIGNYVPVHISPIDMILGNFVYANIGTSVGNTPGLICYFFRGSVDDENNKIAQGHIIHCELNKCTAEIEMYFANTIVQKGDLLVLDEKQWKAD